MLCHCPQGADKAAEAYPALLVLGSSYGSGLHGLDAEQRLVAVRSLYSHIQFKALQFKALLELTRSKGQH